MEERNLNKCHLHILLRYFSPDILQRKLFYEADDFLTANPPEKYSRSLSIFGCVKTHINSYIDKSLHEGDESYRLDPNKPTGGSETCHAGTPL